jgi:hypothetical protein
VVGTHTGGERMRGMGITLLDSFPICCRIGKLEPIAKVGHVAVGVRVFVVAMVDAIELAAAKARRGPRDPAPTSSPARAASK